MKTIQSLSRHCLVIAAVFLAVIVSAKPVHDHTLFSQLVVFGDSISDTGNLYALTGGAIPPAPAYAGGHFSNGQVWVEYLAGQLDLVGLMENYAFGGACTGRDNFVGFEYGLPGLPGLQTEIDLFAAAQGGRADPHALYIVQAGANDIFLWAASGMTTPLPALAQQVAANISDAVTRLQNMGARHILVVNIADLGLTPNGLASGYGPVLTGVTVALNDAVAAKFASRWHRRDREVAIFSLFGALHAIVANPALFGFADVTHPYLVVRAGDPATFLFWDDVHPTTAGHEVLADFVFMQLEQLYPPLRPCEAHGEFASGGRK